MYNVEPWLSELSELSELSIAVGLSDCRLSDLPMTTMTVYDNGHTWSQRVLLSECCRMLSELSVLSIVGAVGAVGVLS